MLHTDAVARALSLPALPERWQSLRETAESRFSGKDFLSDAWLCALEAKFGLFPRSFDLVRRAAAALREHGALRDYTVLLAEALRDRSAVRAELSSLTLPAAPAGADPLPYDFAPLLAMLPLIPDAHARYAARRVPADVIDASFRNFEECIVVFQGRFDRPGFDMRYLGWSQLFLDAKILRLGRLQFEARAALGGYTAVFRRADGTLTLLAADGRFHRDGAVLGSAGYEDEAGAFDADLTQTDTYIEGHPIDPALGRAGRERVRLSREQWTQVLSPRDPVLSVHIPAGPGLTTEACEAAYARARELFPRCYPDHPYRAFSCGSWLMDPQLAGILGPESNIVRFQRPYLRCPARSSGKAVFIFVFPKPVERLEDLPERTTLERALKRHYLEGNCIHELTGIFF